MWPHLGTYRKMSTGMRQKFKKPMCLDLDCSVVQDNVPMEVVPQIFVGSIHVAFNSEALQSRGITHVLNLSGMAATYPQRFTYLTIELRDKDHANLLSCIPASNLFMESAIESGGSVLVHCNGGRSRSPALVIAFLMSTLTIPFEEAYHRVKRARPITCLNRGFETQLRAYAIAKCDVFAAHQVLLQKRTMRIAELREINSQGSPLSDKQKLTLNGGKRASGARIKTMLHATRLRLTRPNSPSVQVIPPLRSMGTDYACKGCGYQLFCAGSIMKHADSPIDETQWGWTNGMYATNDLNLDLEDSLEESLDSTESSSGEWNQSGLVHYETSKRAEKEMMVFDIPQFQPKSAREYLGRESLDDIVMETDCCSKRNAEVVTTSQTPPPEWKPTGPDCRSPGGQDGKHVSHWGNGRAPASVPVVPLSKSSDDVTLISLGRSPSKITTPRSAHSSPRLPPLSSDLRSNSMSSPPPMLEEVFPNKNLPPLSSSSQPSVSTIPGSTIPVPVHVGSFGTPSSPLSRPCSAERRRWLNRIQALLNDGSHKSAKAIATATARADDLAMDISRHENFYIEMLPWMSTIVNEKERGEISCPNPACSCQLGWYDWAGPRPFLFRVRSQAVKSELASLQ